MSYSKLDKQKPKAIYSLTPSVKNDASSIDEAYILPSFVRSHIGDTRYGDDSTRCPHTPGARAGGWATQSCQAWQTVSA